MTTYEEYKAEMEKSISELNTVELGPITPDYQLALQLAVDLEGSKSVNLYEVSQVADTIKRANTLLGWLKENRDET